MKEYEIPEGATHFIQGDEDNRDHFVVADKVGNVCRIYCPDYPGIGWDSYIEKETLSTSALPIASYIEINALKKAIDWHVNHTREIRQENESLKS